MKLYHEQEREGKNGIKKFSLNFTELEEMVKQGLLALSVQLGIKALQIMLEEEVVSHVGERGNTIRNAPHTVIMVMRVQA